MGRRVLGFVAAAVLGGSTLVGVASAAPMSGFAGLLAAEAALNPVENTPYPWDGYDYCWYDDGRRSPVTNERESGHEYSETSGA